MAKRLITIAGITSLIALIMGAWMFLHRRSLSLREAPPANDPFAGFKVMELPRGDAPIGAVWTQTIGPIGKSPIDATVETDSLDRTQVETSAQFRASVVASLFRKLGWDSGGNLQEKRKLQLERLTVTRIKDASFLPFVAGNEYLWEAVRVDGFSLDASTSEAENIRAEIRKVTPVDNFTENFAGQDTRKINASGTKLYVAYRVIELVSTAPQKMAVLHVEEPTSYFDLGKEYRISFEKLHPNDTLFRAGCKVILVATSYRSFQRDGRPVEKRFEESCGLHPQLSYALGNIPAGSSLVANDQLDVSNFHSWPAEEHQANAIGDFAIVRRTLELKTLENPRAPGW